MPMNGEISLYIHVPFCTRKCPYCHFYVTKNEKKSHKAFTAALLQEWDLRKGDLQGKRLTSIYFGGGTPSLWGAENIDLFLRTLQRDLPFSPKEIEVTLEGNPETITPQLMRSYADVGINRVSLGVQTFDDILLKQLGRTHTAHEAIEATYAVAEAGISSLSIDLLYDIPHQTEEIWEHTLFRAQELPIRHISLYNLTFEPHTPYFRKKSSLEQFLPPPETSLSMYQRAVALFSASPWHQYEISAFAHTGYEAIHNTGYWIGRPFLGFGPSAFSYWEGERFQNAPDLKRYCTLIGRGEDPALFREKLDPAASLRERFVIQLRLLRGVDLGHFTSLDGSSMETLKRLESRGWVKIDGAQCALTEQGRLFYDSVASELI